MFLSRIAQKTGTWVAAPQRCFLKKSFWNSRCFLRRVCIGVSFLVITCKTISGLSDFALHCRFFLFSCVCCDFLGSSIWKHLRETASRTISQLYGLPDKTKGLLQVPSLRNDNSLLKTFFQRSIIWLHKIIIFLHHCYVVTICCNLYDLCTLFTGKNLKEQNK